MKFWCGLFVAVALMGRSEISSACGNEVERRVDPRVEALQRAEGLLLAGNEAGAARAVVQQHPGVGQYRVQRGSIESRALRVVALALLRAEGNVTGLGNFPASTPARRSANVSWAIERLRQIRDARPTAAAAQTDYAEALARQTATAAEGLRTLEDLAFRSVLASAHAWAMVARARDHAGRSAERDVALMRCRAMARSASVCQIGTQVASR